MKRYCGERKKEVFTWINDVQKGNIEIDGAIIVCAAAYIRRNVTIISAGKRWSSEPKGNTDVWMCFAGDKDGDKIFLSGEVGKSSKLIVSLIDQLIFHMLFKCKIYVTYHVMIIGSIAVLSASEK